MHAAPRTDLHAPLPRHSAERAVRALVRHRHCHDLCRRYADAECANAARASSALDLAAVRYAPAEAAAQAASGFGRVVLTTVLDRPAYRFASPYGTATVFADTGAPLQTSTSRPPAGSRRSSWEGPRARSRSSAPSSAPINGRCRPVATCRSTNSLWTTAPAQRCSLAGTGEVRLVTTTKTRTLAWIATIPHWFYITPLRTNQPLWYSTVVAPRDSAVCSRCWGSCSASLDSTNRRLLAGHRLFAIKVGCAGTHLRGLWRLRVDLGLQRPLVHGAVRLGERRQPRDLGRRADGGPRRLEQFPPFAADPWTGCCAGATERVEFRRVDDAPYYLARYTGSVAEPDPRRERLHQPYPIAGRAEPQHMLVDARTVTERTEPFATEMLLARLRAARPTRRSSRTSCSPTTTRTTTRATAKRLARAQSEFNDPLETWVYVDPALGQLVLDSSPAPHRALALQRLA